MADQIPDWATSRCHDCGEMFLPGFGAVWSSRQPDRHTHGGLKQCEAQAAYLSSCADVLPLQIRLQEQALVEVAQTLHRCISECDAENWNKEVASYVFAALDSAERGYAAHKLILAQFESPQPQEAVGD